MRVRRMPVQDLVSAIHQPSQIGGFVQVWRIFCSFIIIRNEGIPGNKDNID